MKTNILLIALMSISTILFGQVPQGIPYQAVARDAQGNPMSNQSLTVQFSLHEASADGQVVYQETQTTTTNGQGLFSLTFGAGVPSVGTFANINWGSGYKFLQVQANFGNGYVDLGTQQLMSVPYALYSGSSGNGSNSQNSNFTPSADSVLTLIGKLVIGNGIYTVPSGEVWEIEAINLSGINGIQQITGDLVNCYAIFSTSGRCEYLVNQNNFTTFRLNEWIYSDQINNNQYRIITIPQNTLDVCQYCPNPLVIEYSPSAVIPLNLPLYATAGQELEVFGYRISISKYK